MSQAMMCPSLSVAQTPLDPAQIALACAPPPAYASPQRPALHIAGAQDTVAMAEAMKLAVRAGRLAYLAGRIPRKMYATASSPVEGLVGR